MRRNAKLTALILTAACALPLAARADHAPAAGDGFWIDADVIAVEPLLRSVQVTTPREVCWEEPVRYTTAHRGHRGHRSHTPKIIGGIIGGIVGNQFGSGSGNTAMTAAGALLGASIARDSQYRHRRAGRSYVRAEERCEIEQVTHEEERVDGYRVTYEYNGRTFETHSDRDPGDRIRVHVRLTPVR